MIRTLGEMIFLMRRSDVKVTELMGELIANEVLAVCLYCNGGDDFPSIVF